MVVATNWDFVAGISSLWLMLHACLFTHLSLLDRCNLKQQLKELIYCTASSSPPTIKYPTLKLLPLKVLRQVCQKNVCHFVVVFPFAIQFLNLLWPLFCMTSTEALQHHSYALILHQNELQRGLKCFWARCCVIFFNFQSRSASILAATVEWSTFPKLWHISGIASCFLTEVNTLMACSASHLFAVGSLQSCGISQRWTVKIWPAIDPGTTFLIDVVHCPCPV